MGGAVINLRPVASDVQGNAADLFHMGFHAELRAPAVRDEAESPAGQAAENFERIGGDGQIVPQERIVQVKGSRFQNTTCRNQILSPSTAAFWAGMQARNFSI